MELIGRILNDGNIEAAIQAVKSNRSAAGIDKMTVDALEEYFMEHEGVAEGRFRPVDALQGASSDTQAMEEAKDDLQESDAAEYQDEMWNTRRRYLQGYLFQPWVVSQKRHDHD